MSEETRCIGDNNYLLLELPSILRVGHEYMAVSYLNDNTLYVLRFNLIKEEDSEKSSGLEGEIKK